MFGVNGKPTIYSFSSENSQIFYPFSFSKPISTSFSSSSHPLMKTYNFFIRIHPLDNNPQFFHLLHASNETEKNVIAIIPPIEALKIFIPYWTLSKNPNKLHPS